MKVMDGTAQHALNIRDALPTLTPSVDKKLFVLDDRFRFAQHAQPVRALYVLDRFDPVDDQPTDVEIFRPSPREALLMMLKQTALASYLSPAEIAMAMPLYQTLLQHAPLRILRFPNGFAYQDMVCQAILDDVKDAPCLD
jgi:hypothetical protein